MKHDFKKYEDIKKFFTNSCHTHNPCEVILFHDQRNSVHKLLTEVAAETGRMLIDKDLSTLQGNELGAMKLGNEIPVWLADVMDAPEGKGHVIYLREFHLSPQKVQNDVLNVLLKKDIQGIQFPKNTLIVLGARKEDETAEGLTHTHIVTFYK